MASDELPSNAAAPGPSPASELRGRLELAHTWVLDHWPTTLRRRAAVVLVTVGVILMALDALARLVGFAAQLGLLAYLGLMLVCWIGAGGALVPIPGVRPLSWMMIVQQSSSSPPVLVCASAALAMALGQTSYFIATRAGEHRLAHHHGHGHKHAHPSAPDPDGSADAGPRIRSLTSRVKALLVRAEGFVSREMLTHPRSIIFLLSTVPNPLTTFATVTASAVGVRFSHFFGASLGGFLVLTAILAVGGQALLQALGISV